MFAWITDTLFPKSPAVLEREQKLAVHRSRVQWAYGCVSCGQELLPPQRRWLCGTCKETFSYCEPCYAKNTHKHTMYLEDLYWEVDPSRISECKSISEVVRLTFGAIYVDRPCLGTRKDGEPYTWISYKEVFERIQKVSQQLRKYAKLGDRVMIYSGASVEWYVMEYACFYGGFIVVPVHASTSESNVKSLISKAKPCVIVVSVHLVMNLTGAVNAEMKQLILIEDSIDSYSGMTTANFDGELLKQSFSSISTFSSILLDSTDEKDISSNFPQVNPKGDDVVLLVPSSGSTGTPKLIIVTQAMLMHNCQPPSLSVLQVMFSHQPIDQGIDIFVKGGRVGLISGGIDQMFSDLKLLCPTTFGSTPTFWNRLYSEFQLDLQKADEVKQSSHEVIESWKEKNILGNRCKLVVVGGAPSKEEVRQWITKVFGCYVIDGYGTTETGGLTSNSAPKNSTGGGPVMQLIDCPELGYLTSDSPYPRGEIIAYTSRLTPGYYGDEEETAKKFVTIGTARFFRTGDAGMLIDGKIVVIDRISSFLKLAQGVWVSPSKLEEVYRSSHFVKYVFIYGESLMDCVVAAVVVPPEVLLEETNLIELENKIQSDFARIARESNLKPWETPKLIIVDQHEWTLENECLTSIGKISRPNLRKKYRDQFLSRLETSTTAMAETKEDIIELGSKTSNGINLGLVNLLVECLAIRDRSLIIPDASLVDFGVDSLSFARLSNRIEAVFGTKIPVQRMMRLGSIQMLQLAIFGGLNDELLSEKVSSGNSSIIDWNQEVKKAISLIAMGSEREKFENKKSDVLLTGGSGFLGAFLLQSILCHRSYINSTIYCLVRVDSGKDEDAKQRIVSNLKNYCLWEDSFEERLIGVAGDFSEERMGLDEDHYKALSTKINIVFHNGALVNSVLPYEAHYRSNVAGTANMVNFCGESLASLEYISTIGLMSNSGVVNEDFDVPDRALNFLGGYSQSKWVAEKLVIGFLRSKKNPTPTVRLYRVGTVSGHSSKGLYNSKDSVVLLIKGIIKEKFFCIDDDCPFPSSFNFVPADWAADFIVNQSVNQVVKKNVFHVIQTHFTGVHQIINSIERLGLKILKVSSTEFREKVKVISEDHPWFVFKSSLTGSGFQSEKKLISDFQSSANFAEIDIDVLDVFISSILKDMA
jgi:fatty acid CoA ligase FadD9